VRHFCSKRSKVRVRFVVALDETVSRTMRELGRHICLVIASKTFCLPKNGTKLLRKALSVCGRRDG